MTVYQIKECNIQKGVEIDIKIEEELMNAGMGQWTNDESIPNFFIFIFKSAEKIKYSHYLVIHQSDRQRDGQIDRKHSYMETHTL